MSPKPNSQPLSQVITSVLTVVVSVALTLVTLRTFPQLLSPLATVKRDENGEVDPNIPDLPAQGSGNFVAAAVNRVGPAVVQIDTERTVAQTPSSPFFDDPLFRRFFGEDVLPKLPQEYRQRGQGSGFIIDPSGIILTNAHVLKEADKVTVTLRDGRSFIGEVRGVDEPSDLAVVKIDGEDLPVAPLGNSSAVQVGDWAIAVGNPLGLDNTVTLGIVSTLDRSSSQVGIPEVRLDFIQTDVAINPGNSGGPLLNKEGEVIGINTAIRADAEGIGFAIPIDKAKEIKDQLARGEKIPHPYIGIRMIPLTPEIARQLNNEPNFPTTIPEIEGVLVVEVIPQSPAVIGGLRPGDIIIEVDGTRIKNAENFQDLVEESAIGEPLAITVRRGEQTEQLSVLPGELRELTETQP